MLSLRKSKNINGQAFQKTPKNKFSTRKFIFWGFNLTVGYSFLVAIGGSFDEMGNFMPFLIIGGSFLAYTCGNAFGNLNKIHREDGGIMVYTSKILGRRIGFFVGLFQLLQLPFLSATVVLGMIWAFKFQNGSGYSDLSHEWYVYLGSFLIFFICIMVVNFGFLSSTLSLYLLWVLKWLIIIASMVVSLSFIKNWGVNIFNNGYTPSNIRFSTVVPSIVTFFFAFGGFEAVVSMANDRDEKSSNISTSTTISIMIFLICLFYLVYTYLFIGALGVASANNPNGLPNDNYKPTNSGDYNPINAVFQSRFATHSSWVSGLIVVLLTTTQIANKASSKVQGGWANTRIISSFSRLGYISPIFQNKNKYHQFRNALILDSILSVIISVVILFLSVYNVVNISDSLAIVTIISFLQYCFALISILKVRISNFSRSMLPSILIYSFTLVAILFLLISWYVSGFVQLSEYLNNPKTGSLGVFVSSILLIMVIFFGTLLWYYGKKRGWREDKTNFTKNQFEKMREKSKSLLKKIKISKRNNVN